MESTIMKATGLALVLLAGAFGTANGAQTVGATVEFTLTAEDSDPGGVSPCDDENGCNPYVYHFTVTDGGSVTDSLPITICLTGQTLGDRPWTTTTFSFGSVSGNLSGVTLPSNVVFTRTDFDPYPPTEEAPICQTASISIATGPLILSNPAISENKNGNLNGIGVVCAPTDSPGKCSTNPNNPPNIQIQVTIVPAASNPISCYMTDSEGLLLADCDGVPVTQSGSDDGRFSIVVNKKKNISVATNPGQFYYNVVWRNSTGSEQTVNVDFDRLNLLAKGAQAIHAAVFEEPFSDVSPELFQAVNDAIPGGSDDAIEGITVPAGWTLWVNYHLEYGGLGEPAPDPCTGDCGDANPNGDEVSVTATLSYGETELNCSSGAWGFKKK